MNREHTRCVVQTVLAMMTQIARKTSTPTDDLMCSVLNANQERITDAVLQLLPTETCELPSPEQITAALHQVGIKV